jgi:lysozyme
MCFNMGWGGLGGFTNTLQAIQERRWAAAAAGMRASLWARQVPERAERLARAMASGVMP